MKVVVECPCGQKVKVETLKPGATCPRCKSDLRLQVLRAIKDEQLPPVQRMMKDLFKGR